MRLKEEHVWETELDRDCSFLSLYSFLNFSFSPSRLNSALIRTDKLMLHPQILLESQILMHRYVYYTYLCLTQVDVVWSFVLTHSGALCGKKEELNIPHCSFRESLEMTYVTVHLYISQQ